MFASNNDARANATPKTILLDMAPSQSAIELRRKPGEPVRDTESPLLFKINIRCTTPVDWSWEKIANAKATFPEAFDMRKFHCVPEKAECVKLR
jgi:hypothetical protein